MKCINFFQGKLVADYDVKKYFKAYGGAINLDLHGFGASWRDPFDILELILHKKYSVKGRKSKVGRSVE